ncbi:MAG: hypothetical protein BGP00_23230 [Novosphingobium sp. 63-713]|nr:MAG: hypothetical protein BGP00_23230 [Novosphingobium sp. 63-713]
MMEGHEHPEAHGQGHCHQCDCHIDGHDDMAAKMFHLAKCAKHALLKRKIEQHLDAKIGAKLDRMAQLAADALIDSMQRIGARKQACRRYEDDLLAEMQSEWPSSFAPVE